MNTEPKLVDTITTELSELPPTQQQEVLDFVTFLRQRQEPRPSILERIEARLAQVPQHVLEELPADASENLDHYLYGAPKK